MHYTLQASSDFGAVDYQNGEIVFIANRESDNAFFSMTLSFSPIEKDAYVFLPACAYDGNRMERDRYDYPPMYTQEMCGVSPSPRISEVPALAPDGSGSIEVTAGDLSVPCFGIFLRHAQKAVFVFTEQACKEKNIGFTVKEGQLMLSFPAKRSVAYRMCRLDEPSTDSGVSVTVGEKISSRVLIEEFDCADLPSFFTLFFEHRKDLLHDDVASNGYTKALWSLMEQHFNRDNFSGEYYAEISKKWQCGWVGGGMSSLPLLKHGSPLSAERAIQTIDYLTSHRYPSGFFESLIRDGIAEDDGFGHPHMKDCFLTRKNGDALYFLFKHFRVIAPRKEWVTAAKDASDAFCRLFEKYGSFGQFVNGKTEQMLFGGTTSGASVIGALVLAKQYFGEENYLRIAKLAGEKYYRDFVIKGLTYGGPGEALCAPDSESSFALVESFVLLFEETREDRWLSYAKDATHLFSSWVMPYAYRFPKESEFYRLGINTVGSVFANVQNKHSAPGICTASGDALYKLYRYTKNENYLTLLKEIVYFIPQCVSWDDRPITLYYDRSVSLKSGYICERVNTSDWESPRRVGEVFNASCWCETSLILCFSELFFDPAIPEFSLAEEKA